MTYYVSSGTLNLTKPKPTEAFVVESLLSIVCLHGVRVILTCVYFRIKAVVEVVLIYQT